MSRKDSFPPGSYQGSALLWRSGRGQMGRDLGGGGGWGGVDLLPTTTTELARVSAQLAQSVVSSTSGGCGLETLIFQDVS